MSEAKTISKNEPNNPNSVANIFKELIEQELAQSKSVENPDDENSLPGLSIEEVNLDGGQEPKATVKKPLLHDNNKDDDDVALLDSNQEKLDSYFEMLEAARASAPPSKKIKQ